MPRVTAEQLKAALVNERAKTISVLGSMLRESGYPVDDDWVGKELEVLEGGDDSYRGGPSLFLKGWLKDGIK